MGRLLQRPLIGTTCDKNDLHLANDKVPEVTAFRMTEIRATRKKKNNSLNDLKSSHTLGTVRRLPSVPECNFPSIRFPKVPFPEDTYSQIYGFRDILISSVLQFLIHLLLDLVDAHAWRVLLKL